MDGDCVPVRELEKEELKVVTPLCAAMSSTAVKSANSSVGIPTPTNSSLTASDIHQQQVKILSHSGNLLVDRNAIEKLKDIGYSVQPSSSTRKDGIAGTNLNPLIKISGSPTKSIPIMLADPMPRIGLSASTKSLNKSIKNLVHDDFETRPGHRPPTPARPSLPTLLAGKHDSSTEGSSSSSTSLSETASKTRRVTIANFPRSTSEPKALSVPGPARSSQDEDEHSTDVFDVSTKSEGWDGLWGSRGGRGFFPHSEGHVVPLPPIGHSRAPPKCKEAKKVGKADEENVLNVAKKTLERLETVLSHQYKANKRGKSISRSNASHRQIDMNS